MSAVAGAAAAVTVVPAGDEAAVAVAITSTPLPVALSSRGRNNSGESRGPWTPEEIRLLTEAHAMHPGYAMQWDLQ